MHTAATLQFAGPANSLLPQGFWLQVVAEALSNGEQDKTKGVMTAGNESKSAAHCAHDARHGDRHASSEYGNVLCKYQTAPPACRLKPI